LPLSRRGPAYSRQALNRDAERKAIEIRLRAERRAGQLIKELKESGQLKKGWRSKLSSGTIVSRKTLPGLNITLDESSKWQKLAEIPEEEFEAKLKDESVMPFSVFQSAQPG
jgi:hypothetical protein